MPPAACPSPLAAAAACVASPSASSPSMGGGSGSGVRRLVTGAGERTMSWGPSSPSPSTPDDACCWCAEPSASNESMRMRACMCPSSAAAASPRPARACPSTRPAAPAAAASGCAAASRSAAVAVSSSAASEGASGKKEELACSAAEAAACARCGETGMLWGPSPSARSDGAGFPAPPRPPSPALAGGGEWQPRAEAGRGGGTRSRDCWLPASHDAAGCAPSPLLLPRRTRLPLLSLFSSSDESEPALPLSSSSLSQSAGGSGDGRWEVQPVGGGSTSPKAQSLPWLVATPA
jgi:hypothetical protein